LRRLPPSGTRAPNSGRCGNLDRWLLLGLV
jgi:hypothetical protein